MWKGGGRWHCAALAARDGHWSRARQKELNAASTAHEKQLKMGYEKLISSVCASASVAASTATASATASATAKYISEKFRKSSWTGKDRIIFHDFFFCFFVFLATTTAGGGSGSRAGMFFILMKRLIYCSVAGKINNPVCKYGERVRDG